MFAPRARGLFDFFAAAVCLWAAAYHTPPGALIRTVIARITDTRNNARPLLAYYSGGVYESQTIQTPTEAVDLPQPDLLAGVAQGPAIGRGVFATLRRATPVQKKTATALATRYSINLSRLEDSAHGPELTGAMLGRAAVDLGSEDAAVLAVFTGYEAADFAVKRARAEHRALELENLAPQLPPSEREAIDLASQALTLGAAYALAWPVPSRTRVTSPFGYRTHPTLGVQKLHTGVDLAVVEGTGIRATADGVVRRASEDGVNGKVVILDHGHGVSTAYAHNSRLLVATGQRIKAGDLISESGNTGRSTGPHLHYQLELAHQAMDPFLFKSANVSDTLVPIVPRKPSAVMPTVVDGGANDSDRQSPPSATEF